MFNYICILNLGFIRIFIATIKIRLLHIKICKELVKLQINLYNLYNIYNIYTYKYT